MESLTSFPENFTTQSANLQKVVDFSITACKYIVDDVIISWGILLSRFTEKQHPAFFVNNQPMCVDVSSERFHTIQLEASSAERLENFTVITIDDFQNDVQYTLSESGRDRGLGRCALSLTLNLMTGASSLRSGTGIDYPNLKQIGLQFSQILDGRARNHGSDLSNNSPSYKPQLSIVNPHPAVLAGAVDVFELVSRKWNPSHTAIEFLHSDGGLQKLSYEDLVSNVTTLAARISVILGQDLTEEPRNVVIPTLLPQSPDIYIAWLAILKAGAAFCPINLDSPPERVEFILRDVSAKLIVTNSTSAHLLPTRSGHPVLLTDDTDDVLLAADAAKIASFSGSLAYVMYTSGSTGKPKGVAVSHRAATQSLLAHDGLIPSFDRFLQFASPTFDVSVFEVFFPLFRGATLVGCDRNRMLRDLTQIIAVLNVDAAELTPSVASELLRHRNQVPSLRLLLTIGEMLNRRVVDEFGSSSTQSGLLYAMYGPTEATIHCTAAPRLAADACVNLIGRPFATVSCFIVSLGAFNQGDMQNFDHSILPVGQIGELVLGGPQLAEGYINRPQDTSKAFIQTTNYGRLYRTGDKARLLPDGTIECLGRIDGDQIKLRGQRVELGEIESAAGKATGVVTAVAALANGTLVLFVQVDSNEGITTSLHEVCARWLPRFMIPADYVLVDSFPHLPSGKVDRKRLVANYLEDKRGIRKHRDKSLPSPFDSRIFLAVSEVLKTDPDDLDSLSASGLDSLSAILLAAKLRSVGVKLDVGSLLMVDTLPELCRLAEAHGSSSAPQLTDGAHSRRQVEVEKAGWDLLKSIGLPFSIDRVMPCSHIQTGMLMETVRNPHAYCNWSKIQFSPELDPRNITDALHVVAHQHDILRSGFLCLGMSEAAFCSFIMSSLPAGTIRETSSFEYQWQVQTDKQVLLPLRIQLKQDEEGVSALVHVHHAIYDGWSWELILADLQSVLSKRRLDSRPSYSIVVEYYGSFDQSECAAESRTYWRDRLHDSKFLLWPDYNDKIQDCSATGVAGHTLSVSLYELDEICQRFRVSRQSVFQAAFAYLLGCYLGTSDVIFATVFSGRTLPVEGIEQVLGPCTRVLPTRIDLEWVRTVSDLVVALHDQNRQSLKYGDLSLSEIKKISGSEAPEAWIPALIVWQETPWTCQKLGHDFQETESMEFLEFPLTLQLEPKDGRIQARAIHERAVLSLPQTELFLKQVDEIVLQIITSPSMLIGDVNDKLSLSLLSIENPHFEAQSDLPQLARGVEKMAESDPTRNAVEFLHTLDTDTGKVVVERLSYHDLNSKANQVARHLISRGVGRGDVVSIIMDKGVNLYIFILAVIKIGAGYLPILPSTPKDRLQSILTEAKPRCNIIDKAGLARIQAFSSIASLSAQDIQLDGYPDTDISTCDCTSSIAYIIFTSGSTGTPKGVLISHHNLFSNISTLMEIYPIGPEAKMLQACSHAFDVSAFEIFFAWSAGMTLCSSSNDVMFRDIEQVIHTMRVTHLSLTPTVAAFVHPSNVPGVRFLVTAGEALSAKVHRDWGGNGLYQGYGPSETTNICTVRPDLDMCDNARNIGRPLRNTSAFVLSGRQGFSLVPRGGIGELCFGGDQVGLGYLNSGGLTKATFVDHPTYGRLYRSGDYGRMLSNGSLVFTGRRDDQVKIRGQRVELGEIDAILLRQSMVRNCTTLIIKREAQDQELLVTFWTSNSQPTQSSIRQGEWCSISEHLFEALRDSLPTYMVPTYLIPVQAIPMTDVRKIDFRKLQNFFFEIAAEDLFRLSGNQDALGTTEAFGQLEEDLARIVSMTAAVPLENVGLNTSFYALGIDSISAIHLSRHLRNAGYGQWDISAILQNATVGRLAALIAKDDKHPPPKFVPLTEKFFEPEQEAQILSELQVEGKRVSSILPCTALQETMLSRRDSGTAYLNHLVFEVYVDIRKVIDAWEGMMLRHEMLRTLFLPIIDRQHAYVQVVLEEISLPWTRQTAGSHALIDDIQNRKDRFGNDFCRKKILPYCLTIFETSQEKPTVLLLSIHHALHDGESLSNLFKEVELTVSGKALPKVTQFQDFINYSLSQESYDVDLFWKQYLVGLSPQWLCRKSQNRGCSKVPRYQLDTQKVPIDLASFTEMCQRCGVSPLNVFHAAWARLVALHTHSLDVCFGNVFSCRTIPLDGVENIIGPCFNSLPLRIKISPSSSNLDVMLSAQTSNVRILPYQLTSLRRIMKSVNEHGTSIFDSLLIFQQEMHNLDESVWKLSSEEGVMDFPIVCEVIISAEENCVVINLHSDGLYMSQADANYLARTFSALIDHTITYPATRATDEEFLSQKPAAFLENLFQCDPHPSTYAVRKVAGGKELSKLSAEQKVVQEALSTLSGVTLNEIGVDTTIFQLGLDSINAIQLSSLLAERGYDVYPPDILEKPSLAQVAALLTRANQWGSNVLTFDLEDFDKRYRHLVCEKHNIASNSVETLRPCTPVQNGIIAQYISSGMTLYLNRIILTSVVPLNKSLLKSAWSKVVARHEMLRTGFVQVNDQQFPFGMVTYGSGDFALPWSDYPRDVVDRQIASRLHTAPWSVMVRKQGKGTEMEFVALHAIYDAQSLDIILSDLIAVYQGHALAGSPSINPLLCKILLNSSTTSEPNERFWREHLQSAQITKFPNLSPERVEKLEFLVTERTCSLDLSLIDERCRELGVSIQAIGQVAWARLLSAYTGEKRVTFGVVFSGRSSGLKEHDVAFPSLVILPYPCNVEGNHRDLLKSIIRTNAQLLRVQYTPLAKIQRLMNVDERLFDTLFVYQKRPDRKFDSSVWEKTREEASGEFPVTIELTPDRGRLELLLTHRSDIVPSKHAEILLEQVNHLIIDSLYSPGASLIDQSRMKDELLSISPSKEQLIPTTSQLLHQLVEDTAVRYPARVALEFATNITETHVEKRTWSYCQLNKEGNRVANLLLVLGARPADLVAICFDKCPEASFAILGILKTGCAFVALDPAAPCARKQFMLEDSGVNLLVCTLDKVDDLKTLKGVQLVVVDNLSELDDISCEAPVLERPILPDDLCYCLYTSGTTGTPKGCEITHQNVVQAMLAFTRIFESHWDTNSRWLQFASFHFDVSVLEQFWSWSVGICVTSCPRDLLFQNLTRAIQLLGITHIDLTPSLALLLDPDDVPSLSKGVFITGGEHLKQGILDKWGKHQVIYNGYGPTEVTIGCTMLPRMGPRSKTSNIGPQFDNVGSYILAPGTALPVLRGGIGELCVTGALVGRGYLNRPDLTKEKFQVLDRFHERIYRTGDLVRILYDGSFQFLGRIDDQVKLRGQRLEIKEINTVIQEASSDIAFVATIVAKHPLQAKEQLISFITRNKSGAPKGVSEVLHDPNQNYYLSIIRTAISRKLPNYMIPTHLIPMTSFPLSPNNKIEIKTLKSIYEQLTLEDLRSLSSTKTELRREINDVLQKVINVIAEFNNTASESISPAVNLLQLGLDSISAISLAQTLRDAGFASADTSLILRSVDIAELASSLQNPAACVSAEDLYRDGKQQISAFTHKYSLQAAGRLQISIDLIQKVLPCTPLQEGMVMRFLASKNSSYCSYFLFRVNPSTSLDCLREAWVQTQREEQILRIRLTPLPVGCVQVLLDVDELPWNTTIVTRNDEIEDAVQKRFNLWCARVRSLTGSWWEIQMIQCHDEILMQLNIFHALYDGNSIPLLLDRVARHCLGVQMSSSPKPTYLETLPLGPLRRAAGAKDFWCQHLEPSPKGRIFESRQWNGQKPVIVELELIPPLNLTEMRSLMKVTDQAIFHACWLIVLREHFLVSPTLGVVVSGRAIELSGAADVIGPLFNTIPSYIELSSVRTWAELVKGCHEFYVSTLPFQHTALRDIKKWTAKNQEDPLFEVLFTLQKRDTSHPSLADGLWTIIESRAGTEYPLALEVNIGDKEQTVLTLATNDDCMTMETANSLLELYQTTLLEMTKNPETKTLDLQQHGGTKGRNTYQRYINDAEDSNCRGNTGDFAFQWDIGTRLIQTAIADMAKVDEHAVQPTTSIFELGLDSIDAINLSSRLRESGMLLSVSDIMKYRTIQRVADKYTKVESFGEHRPITIVQRYAENLKEILVELHRFPDNCETVLPATPLQEAMVAEMITSRYKHYWNTNLLEVEPGVDLERLRHAWKLTIDGNPILRTSFTQVDSPRTPFTYAQVIHRSGSTNIDVLDLKDQSVQQFMDRERTCIPSDESIPFRILAIKSGSKTFFLILMAHALYDGWSLDLIHEDVARFYIGEAFIRPSYLPMVFEIIESSGDKARKFWQATLSGYKHTAFPTRSRMQDETNLVHHREKTLTTPTVDITAFCKRYDLTIQTLAVTAWALALGERTRSLDVVFGLVLSGRHSPEAQNMIFPTMNTVAFRAILHGSGLEMLKDVQDTLLEMLDYQHFPLRKMRAGAKTKYLFDTLFIFQNRPQSTRPGLQPLYKSVGGSAEIEFPLALEMELVEDQMIARISCKDILLSDSETHMILDRLGEVLYLLVSEPTHSTLSYSPDNVSILGGPPFSISAENEVNNDVSRSSTTESEVWNAREKVIRKVLSVVSLVPEEKITKDLTLFHLGLDSISAIKVSSLLKKKSINIPVNMMLEAGTIQNMASSPMIHEDLSISQEGMDDNAHIWSHSSINSLLKSRKIGSDQVERISTPTAGQEYFLAMNALNHNLFYPEFFYSTVRVDAIDLEKAWNSLIEKLPILRTLFVSTGERKRPFLQIVLKTSYQPIVWHFSNNLTDWTTTAKQSLMKPVSLHAMSTDANTFVMLKIHHALYDAISLPRMMTALARLLTGQEFNFPEVDLPSYVAFQQKHSSVAKRRQFWKTYLGEGHLNHTIPLPLKSRSPLQQYYKPQLVAMVSEIERVARRNGLSVQALFLSVYAKTFLQFVLEDDPDYHCESTASKTVVFGVYIANRGHELKGLMDMLAPTLAILPLKIRLEGTVLDVARKVQVDLHEISRIENCGVSLVEIADWTGIYLDAYVNFLRIPDSVDIIVEEDQKAAEFISILPQQLNTEYAEGMDDAAPLLEIDAQPAYTRLTRVAHNPQLELPSNGGIECVADVFKDLIDLEVAIRDDHLDVGIFSTTERLHKEKAEAMMGEIKRQMIELTKM